MHKIIKKISQAVQVLLLAPIKLPGKALNIIKYVAVGLGVLEAVTRKEAGSDAVTSDKEEEGNNG
ncbi:MULTISPECIES: hypothetical protein [Sphingobacterium]|uniref:hypothetical protein n=1 Tax=Sphingobacterium TaxID=28453 RepID=UPI0013DBD792|nr:MULTISPECIES: hypothetical protein [unclassified Sphingobacterium]